MEKIKTAVIGAGGKMGTRTSRNLIIRSCTNRHSAQLCEQKMLLARQKIAGILCVFPDFLTQPTAF